jgi:hypothetical protein
MHMSSIIYEESGYNLDLDLPTISYKLCVSYPRRNGSVGKKKSKSKKKKKKKKNPL